MTIPAAYSNARCNVTPTVFRLCQKLEGNDEDEYEVTFLKDTEDFEMKWTGRK
jgi:hypothetical protein